MAKLTKAFIDKVQPPEKGYQVHWDESVKGYGLRVATPEAPGKAPRRVFIVMGRVAGKSIQFTIGAYGTYTEDAARKRAQKLLQDMREGIDPRDAKKHDAAIAVTLRDVVDAYKDRPGKLKESSADVIERHATTTFETWLSKPIASITEDDVRKRYREMLTKGLRGKAGAPGQANQAFAVLRALINFASRRYRRADGSPIITHNPVGTLKDDWVQLKPRTSRVPDLKVGVVWAALERWRAETHNREAVASIDLMRFLMLTGCRLKEAASLRWDQVNLEEGWFHLPDPKNRNPVWLPLSSQAVELIRSRTPVEGNPHVFASWSRAGHIIDPRDTRAKVSVVAGTKITNHDLRRTYITIGVASCGVDFTKIELLTNHIPNGSVTAKHYLETSRLQYLKPETQRIADWIEMEAAKANGANVIAMPQRTA
jgi:integrase